MRRPIKASSSQLRLAAVAALGLFVIAVLLGIGLSGPAVSCGDGAAYPAAAFQAARSATDLESIFGGDGSICRTSFVQGLKVGAVSDLILFIPLYSIFLVCFARHLDGWTKATSFFLAVILLSAIVGDILETAAQLLILDDIDNGARYLDVLAIGNALKVVGLASVWTILSHTLWRSGNNLTRLFATLLGVCAIFRVAAFAIEPLRSLSPLSALAAYILLLACILVRLSPAWSPKVH